MSCAPTSVYIYIYCEEFGNWLVYPTSKFSGSNRSARGFTSRRPDAHCLYNGINRHSSWSVTAPKCVRARYADSNHRRVRSRATPQVTRSNKKTKKQLDDTQIPLANHPKKSAFTKRLWSAMKRAFVRQSLKFYADDILIGTMTPTAKASRTLW